MIFPFNDNYTVGITGKETDPFTEKANEYETSGARFYSGKQGLYEADALYWDHYRPHILTLKAADKDWVFSVYSGSLTTDTEARHLNIEVPNNRYHFTAETGVYFLTGLCIRRR